MISRLLNLLRTHGLGATVAFVASRVLRTRRHLVFSCDCPNLQVRTSGREGESVSEVGCAEDIDSLIGRGFRLPDGLDEYLNAVRSGEAVGLLVYADGQLAHWAFLIKRTRTLCHLGFGGGETVLLGSAFTQPEFRGRGLQTRSVAYRLQVARRLGYATAISETSPDNEFSARALRAGGMTYLHSVQLWIVLNHFVIRKRIDSDKRITFGFCR